MRTEFFMAMIPPTMDNVNKEWRDVPGYEGLYKVNPLGEIFSEYSKRKLTPYVSSDGYLRVNLCKDKKVKTTMLHRIVAEVFIENPHKRPIVNHIDGNKANPIVKNLEWVTCSENIKHAFDNGLSVISEKCRKKASVNAAKNGAKTTSKAVIQIDNIGNIIRKFKSMREAERVTQIPRQNIARACRSHEYSAGGFKWKID